MLIESYTTLRQREGGSSARSTWRITVRQLESLVRLAEALAKLECGDEVTVRHVKEAKRLLSNSIIRVEQPDVDLDEDDFRAGQNGLETNVDDAPPLMAALNALGNEDTPNSGTLSEFMSILYVASSVYPVCDLIPRLYSISRGDKWHTRCRRACQEKAHDVIRGVQDSIEHAHCLHEIGRKSYRKRRFVDVYGISITVLNSLKSRRGSGYSKSLEFD